MQLRCKYARKPCPNMRSVKANGELHTLCQHHRRRANEIQLRWYTRQQPTATTATEETVRLLRQASSDAPVQQQQVAQSAEALTAGAVALAVRAATLSAHTFPTPPDGDDGSSMCDLLSEETLLEFLQQIDLDDDADSLANEAVFGSFAMRL